jgi:transposase-like protein
MEQLNLASLPKYLSDEAAAWDLLEQLRWSDGIPVCPHCGTKDDKHYRLGTRETRTGKVSYRKLYKCRDKACRRQFSVLVGTIFESTKVPVAKWLLALYLMGAGKNGVSALELQRHLNIAYQTAWFIGHRLREAMKREPLASLLSGTVVADETFIGGKQSNKHRQGKSPGQVNYGATGTHPFAGKTPVLALINKASGEARTKVVADVTGATLAEAMTTDVDARRTVLHTDGHRGYRMIAGDFAGHEYVDHSSWEYVRGEVSTNLAESFFAQFKRSLDGTFHNVSVPHLHRYTAEFTFRWNTRKLTDHQRVQRLVDGTRGRRLTYKPLTTRG